MRIQTVGIKDIQLPVRIREKKGGLQNTVATVNMKASMPSRYRESCVNIFISALNKYMDEMSVTIFSELLNDVKEALYAESANLEMTFPYFIEKKAHDDFPALHHIIRTFPGIGQIIGLTILYEIGDIKRFACVQKFASYSRLVKCKAESAGKTYGTSGNKIGNGYLKWAFSEAAVLYLRNNDKAKRYLEKLQKRMNKAKALSALAHKIGRCVYFMLRDKKVFDEDKFLKG